MNRITRSNFQPTSTVPGSKERLRVMEQRHAAGQPLFHPDDTKDDISKAIKGYVARNGVVQKTTEAVDIREETPRCQTCHQPKKLSSILKVFRKRAGYSFTGLSRKSGVSRRTIIRIENGEHDPTFTTISALLGALGITLQAENEAVA